MNHTSVKETLSPLATPEQGPRDTRRPNLNPVNTLHA
jgi:hypothetical protein